MAARDLIGMALFAGAGILLYDAVKKGMGGVVTKPAGNDNAPAQTGILGQITGYLSKLSSAESSGQPYVKAKTSSASGKYQFTKSTWIALGGAWGNDPTQAFGGLKPSIAEQDMRAAKLTKQNGAYLAQFGLGLTSASLYAAHFLGPLAAVKVLAAPAGSLVKDLVSAATVKANPFLAGMTVADFKQWLNKKVG